MNELKLNLLWSPAWQGSIAEIVLGAYIELRPMRFGERDEWLELMRTSGFFRDPDKEALALFEEYWPQAAEDGSWIAVFDTHADRLVASDFMVRKDTARYLNAAELFYIAVLPAYRGRGLARAITAYHMREARRLGLSNLFVETDDLRLDSIANCLKLGFRPCLYADDMPERWRRIYASLGRPFEPGTWPTRGETQADAAR